MAFFMSVIWLLHGKVPKVTTMPPLDIKFEAVQLDCPTSYVLLKIQQGGGLLYSRHKIKGTNKVVWRALFRDPDGSYRRLLAPKTQENREFKSLDTLINFHERIFTEDSIISLPCGYDVWSIEHKLDSFAEE